MKRSIPRSLVSKAMSPPTDDDAPAPEAPAAMLRGAGSAWKAGALAQSQAAVEQGRAQLAADILAGRHELRLDPDQIKDPLGTDRRADWMDQEAFAALVASIEANGQDTPILVWPEDPSWTPDPLDPTAVDGVPFLMLTGRRRHAAARQLGLTLRAILAPADGRMSEDAKFNMLFLRFRENEARENLSPFERLLSIGEMYEALKSADRKLTAVAFATRIGVHESLVSRARAVFAGRDQILNGFKNAYEMSFRDLQTALSSLETKPKRPAKKAAPKLSAKRKIGNRNLALSHANGTLSIKAAGLSVDQDALEELSDLIADFFNTKRAGGAD